MNFPAQRTSVFIFLAAVIFLPFSMKIFSGHVFFIFLPLVWVVLVRRQHISCLGISSKNGIFSIVAGILSGIVLGLLAGVIFNFIGFRKIDLHTAAMYDIAERGFGFFRPSFNSASRYFLARSTSADGIIVYFLYTLFFVGFGEELFWRGFIQKYALRRLSKAKAMVVTAFIFTLIHVYVLALVPFMAGMIFLLMIGASACLWGYLSYRLENILVSAISHGIAAFVVWRLYVFRI
ncbi:MAG: CPBP family intramembrane glutamic endopeptidase [Candidatus Omnitrophota bacterium]